MNLCKNNYLKHDDMKRITSLLLSCLAAVAMFNMSAVSTSDYVIDEGKPAGDVNNDERVNVSDVSALINMILGSTAMDQSRADVNGDGRVNVSDVSALINMILGITPMDQTAGDVNGDGRVNVSDVSALINIILGI